jgi:hypothetical protein
MTGIFFRRARTTAWHNLKIFTALSCFPWQAFATSPGEEPVTVETETSPVEPSPHWRKPPAHSRWEIVFQHEPPASDPAAASDVKYRPLKVTVTRHGRDMLQEVLMEDGKRWETWVLGQVQIQSIAGDNTVWLKPPTAKSHGSADATEHHSFGEFQWIRKEHFRGTFPVLGIRAAVFLRPIEDRSPEGTQKLRHAKKGPLAGLPLCNGIVAAAIHPETKHPILLQKGTTLSTYSIKPLVQEVLKLPEKVTHFRRLLAAPARVAPKPLP